MNLQEEQEIITLNEVCRACLVKTDNMKHLLEPSEEIIQIMTKLSSISNIETEINDTLPCFLCSSCEEKLKISYDFQQLCLKSHQFVLTCVSASSVSFKVNSLKSLNFEESSEKSAIQSQQLDNYSDGFISFVDNDGLEKKILVSYCCLPDLPDLSSQDNGDILKVNQENPSHSSTQVVEGLNELRDENAETCKIEVTSENCVKPSEVEKRTKWNQTMRLPQFSPEEVNRIIKKTRERLFKHVNCLHCGFTAKDSRALSLHMTRLHKEMKKGWCLWCNKNFDNLDEHVKFDHKDDFKCSLCGKYKLNIGHFMEHLASHSIERNHVCGQCGKCFISQRHLKTHSRVHSKQKPYRCKVCSKVFMMPESLNNHLKTHKIQRCRICEQCFSSAEEYREHKCFSEEVSKGNVDNIPIKKDLLELEHKEFLAPQNYCKICNKRVRSLQKHVENVHPYGNNLDENKQALKALCSYCGKRFKNLAKLNVHVRIHTGEMPYKCSFCDKRMTTRIHLVVHERTHTGEKPHICKFCGKGFAQSSVLNTHMKLHTGRTEECTTCHKRFCRPSELKQHMRTHTGEKPYVCNICGDEFAQSSHLAGHSKKHSNERPYKCNYCDKSFKQASALRSHINIHLGKKPYKCNQCPYACRQSHSLKQHMFQHENEQKPEQVHKCEVCSQCFKSFEMYSLHYNSEHETLEGDVFVKENLIEVSTTEVMENLQEFT